MISFVVVAYLFILSPFVQKKICDDITSFLTAKTGSVIEIKGVEFYPFNKIVLKDFYVEDYKKDTLIYAKRLIAKIDSFSTDKPALHLNKIWLENSFINLYEKEGVVLNYVPLIDSLTFQTISKLDTAQKKRGNFIFSVKNIQLKDSKFAYLTYDREDVDYSINWNDILLTGLNIDIKNLQTQNKGISFEINKIGFKERTGFKLDRLQCKGYVQSDSMSLKDVNIITPYSKLHLDTLQYLWTPGKQHWKYFTRKMKQKYIVTNSSVSFRDLAYFNERLKGFRETFTGSAKVYGTVNRMRASDILINYGDSTVIKGNFKSKGLPSLADTYFDANFDLLQTNKKDIENIYFPWEDDNRYTLPDNFSKLGNVIFRGNFNGYLKDFKCKGDINTKAGRIYSNLQIYPGNVDDKIILKGEINTYNFNSAIITNNSNFGDLSLDSKINGMYDSLGFKGYMHSVISEFTYNNYRYNNLKLNGYFAPKEFKGKVLLDDTNIKASFDGSLSWKESVPKMNFVCKVTDAQLDRLNLYQVGDSLITSFNLKADFSGNSISSFLGRIKFSETTLTNKRGKLTLNNFYLFTESRNDSKTLTLLSDFADMDLVGKYDFNTLEHHLRNFIYFYIPAYAPDYSFLKNDTINHFYLSLNLKDTKNISNLFFPNIKIAENSRLHWEHKINDNEINLNIFLPKISYGDNSVENFDFNLFSNSEKINIKTSASTVNFLKDYSIYNFKNFVYAGDNKYSAEFMWSNWGSKTYSGYFGADAKVSKNENTGTPYTTIDLKQGTIMLADSLWVFNPATIIIDNKNYSIDNFEIQRKNQYIGVSGKISKNINDSLKMSFRNCNLNEFNKFFRNNKYKPKGILNGYFTIKDFYKNKFINSDIKIDNMSISKDTIGDLMFASRWDKDTKKIYLKTSSERNNRKQVSLNGWYRPSDEKIYVSANINELSTKFLENNFPDAISQADGSISGNLYMYNKIYDPNIVGSLWFDTDLKIKYTQTKYSFKDTLLFRAEKIYFKDFDIKDENNNNAKLRGVIDLKNDDMFDLNMSFNKFKLLNTSYTDNQSFYGKAYASGVIQIKGGTENMDIDISATSEKNTDINIPIDQNDKVVENNFITFINGDTKQTSASESEKGNSSFDYSNINLNCNLEITEDADTKIILDSKLGESIKGKGEGNIRLSLLKTGDIELYGDYLIKEGSYLFSLQNVINKKFTIAQGSSIKWNGDPYKADINIDAIYKVRTTLHELIPMDDAQNGLNNRKIPVSCIMQLREELKNPQISFAIDFPSLEQQTKSYVESLFRSQDDINKQILYLLVLNKFYTPDYISNDEESQNYSENAGITTASELLSNQLSNWISQISNDVDFGFKYHPKNEISSDEIELALSTQILNDRVEININGNVDMGNNPDAQERKNNIVGDFEIDVKLNPQGSLRLKAYSHNNEELTYKSANTTQGVGISYQEEFNKFKDLLKKYFPFFFKKEDE